VITPRNTALLLAYNQIVAPAAVIHEAKDRVVLDAIVQEIDIATGAVVFEWHALGNVALRESYFPAPEDRTVPYDFVHPNSVAVGTDGNLLVSARHTSTVYEIDRTTGALDWRLGGKLSSFTIPSGARFSWQHDARAYSDGTLSVFDNASMSPDETTRDSSRGLLLHIDQPALNVTLVRSDDNPRGALSTSQGDLQMLANGDWFAGWGSIGEYTEFDADGRVVLDAALKASTASYRAYRFGWTATPVEPPVAVGRRDGNSVVVAASWNGATNVARWQVLVGSDRDSLHPVGVFPRTDFETRMRVLAPAASMVAVRALGPRGALLVTSVAARLRAAT